MKIVILWSRFGPYHLARLKGAALADPHACVIGVEVAGTDRQYAWDRADGAEGFERVTVFSCANYHDLSERDITIGVLAELDRIDPTAVAINGWSVPEARAALSWCGQRRRAAVVMSESKADDHRRRWWKELVKKRVVRRFHAALVGGAPHEDYLVELGFPRELIRRGYDAVDNAYFIAGADAARIKTASIRSSLGLPEPYFFACARFLRRKNLDGLLRAYGLYRRRTAERPWDLVIAGRGDEEANLRSLSDQLELKGVRWVGFLQYADLPLYFGLASAFVHPAKSEPWGLVVNEAAASGLPLLVSRTVGSAYELVRSENGLTFDPFSDEAIARNLIEVAEMTNERRYQLGQASRWIVGHWSPSRFGAELLAAIDIARSRT